MQRTVTRHRPADSPRGDVTRTCGYCGVEWHRSKLRRDAAGILACPDDQPGLDAVSLTEGNAMLSSQRMLGQYTDDSDGGIEPPNTTPSPGFKNANGPPTNTPQGGPTGPLSVSVYTWLRADNVQKDSDGFVETWPDKNQGRGSPTQGTSVLRGTPGFDTSINAPYVQMPSLAQFLRAVFSRFGPMWAWAVIRQDTWVGSNRTFYNAGFALVQVGVSPQIALLGNGATTPNGGAPVGSWKRLMSLQQATGNDTLLLGSALTTDASAGLRNGSGLTVGFSGNSAAFSCAELLLTNGSPTAAEIATIEAYGAARYGASVFT